MKIFALVAATVLGAASSVHAGTVTLDFETAATGQGFNSGPVLATPLGNITLDNQGSPCVSETSQVRAGSELPTNVLCLNDNGTFDLLLFDFAVDSISGDTEIRGGGSLLVEALDALNAVIASYSTSNSTGAFSFNPATSIFALRISDPSLNFSGLDNLVITSASVPEPGSLALTALALLGLARLRRRQQ